MLKFSQLVSVGRTESHIWRGTVSSKELEYNCGWRDNDLGDPHGGDIYVKNPKDMKDQAMQLSKWKVF